jgi:hypothetical protein
MIHIPVKRFLLLLSAGVIFFAACKKGPGVTTRLLVYNATLTTASLTATWSGTSLTPTALAQGDVTGTATAPYQAVPAGTNNIIVKSGSNVLFDKNIYGGGGIAYSLLVYDSSITAVSPSLLLLTDNLALTDSIQPKYRFINCSPDTTINLYLVDSRADTVRVEGSTFIGKSPDPANFQSFTTMTTRTGVYTPYIYKVGSTTLLLKGADINFSSLKAYSLIYSGTSGSSGAGSLKLSVIILPVE